MNDPKRQPKKQTKKRPILVSILCYVLLVEAWFYFQFGRMQSMQQSHITVSAHVYSNVQSLMTWLSVACIVASIGLFFMSKIGFYVLLAATLLAAVAVLFMHLNIGLTAPMFIMSAIAWVFRKQYRWFK